MDWIKLHLKYIITFVTIPYILTGLGFLFMFSEFDSTTIMKGQFSEDYLLTNVAFKLSLILSLILCISSVLNKEYIIAMLPLIIIAIIKISLEYHSIILIIFVNIFACTCMSLLAYIITRKLWPQK